MELGFGNYCYLLVQFQSLIGFKINWNSQLFPAITEEIGFNP
ncbi:hypothetical protein BFG60_3037 [Microcystis aeruginosa NIES-98]|nr:hypothetical protein BFG60_3037 [Microcystis aeruginosa NIES-98]